MSVDPNVPPTLFDLQKWVIGRIVLPLRELGEFRLPIYSNEQVKEIEQKISPGPRLTAAQRIGIHNQQFWFRLFTLLQGSYPALTRLFGYRDFNHLIAEPYLLKYPPNHWALSALGSRLPRWVEEEYWEEDRALILPIALLDGAHDRLFYAPSLKPVREGDLKPTLFLQPFVALFALEADFIPFRKALLEKSPDAWGELEFPSLDRSSEKKGALYRDKEEIFYEELSQEDFAFLKKGEEGVRRSDAPSLLFQKWAKRGWLTAEVLKEEAFPWAAGLRKSRPESGAVSSRDRSLSLRR